MKKLIKILCLILAVALGLFSFAGCKRDEKVLVMATNAAFPPYEFVDDDGEYAGIDVEMMQEVCDILGYELKVENMDFDSIIPAIQSGTADVGVAGMTVTDERKVNVDFTDTYTKSKQVIIVKEGSEIKTPDDLEGKKVGVQLGTTGDLYITWDQEDEVYKDVKIERFRNGIEAVQSMLVDSIDAVIIDNEPAKVFVEKNEGLKILEAEYIEEEYAIAVKKGNENLLSKINSALNQLKENGELQKIIDNHIKA